MRNIICLHNDPAERRSLFFVCVVAALWLLFWNTPLPVLGQDPPTADFLMDAHVAAVQSLRALDITVEIFSIPDEAELSRYIAASEEKPKSELLLSQWRWSREGAKERIRLRNTQLQPRSDGLPHGFSDQFSDGKSASNLDNWDPEGGFQIIPTNQGIVRASQAPQNGGPQVVSVASNNLLLYFQFDPSSPNRNLKDFCDAAARWEMLGTKEVDGHPCLNLRVYHPDADGTVSLSDKYDTANSYHDLFLDPGVAFLVRRADVYYHQLKAGDLRLNNRVGRTVKSFIACPEGSYFPVRIAQDFEQTQGTDAPKHVYSLAVVSASVVNETLPVDALNFSFPEYTIVRVFESEATSTAMLWGKEGPIKEIKTAEDLREFAELDSRFGEDSSLTTTFLILNLAVLAAIVCAIFVYKRKKHRTKLSS